MLLSTFLELALNSGHILEVAPLKIGQTLPSPDTQAFLTILGWNTFQCFCSFCMHPAYSSFSNATESESCVIAFMEVVKHSYGEPWVYDVLASHKMILEGYFHIFISVPLTPIPERYISALSEAPRITSISRIQSA